MPARINFDREKIAAFCRKWRVRELELFGSVLREDFRPDSDVDILVTFQPDNRWSLWDWPEMTDDLRAIFGRDIDLVEKQAVTNPFRRRHIRQNREVIYAA